MFGSFLFIGFQLALHLLPPQKVVVLQNMQSVWTVFIAPFFFNEYPNCLIASMVAASLAGVIILVDPSMILPASLYSPKPTTEAAYPTYYYLIPVFTSFVAVGTNTYLKLFAGRINAFQNVFFFILFASLVNGLCINLSFFQVPARVSLGVSDVACLVVSGISVSLFQIFLCLANKYERRASIIGVLLNSQIVFTFVLDTLIRGTPVETNNIVGGLIVIIASAAIGLSKEKASQANATTIVVSK